MRFVLAFLVVCTAAITLSDHAGACSCAAEDPREMVARADAAVIGTIVDGGTPATLHVEERIKGDVADEIELPNGESTGAYEPDFDAGEKVGLLLDRDGDGWSASLCSRVDPAELRRAAAPLPEPVGHGTARFIGIGSYSGNRLTVLDGRGRVLAYGRGKGWAAVSVCPGSQRVVETVGSGERPRRILVRRLRDMKVVARARASRTAYTSVVCLSPSGARLALFETNAGEPRARGRLVVRSGRRSRTVRRGELFGATIAGRVAYVDEGKWGQDLVAVDLRTGKGRAVARVSYLPGEWEVSPDGRYLATVAFGRELTLPDVLVLVDLRTGAVRERRVGYSTMAWIGPGRLMHNGGRLKVFDTRLRVVRRGGRAPWSEDLVPAGGRFVVVSRRHLYEVDPRSLRSRRIAELPSDNIRSVVALSGGAEIALPGVEPPRPVPRRMIARVVACW